MAFYAKKTSILGSDAVPTDGVMYYTGNKTWSNEESDKVTFDSETVLTADCLLYTSPSPRDRG